MSSSPVYPVQITVTNSVTVQLCPHRQCPLYKSLSVTRKLSLYNYVLIASVPCTNHCHQLGHCAIMSSSPVSAVQITVSDKKTVTIQLCPHRQCPLYKSLSVTRKLSLYNYVLIASVPCTNHCHWHQTCHCTTMFSSPVYPVQITVTNSVTVQLCPHRQCPLYKSMSLTPNLSPYNYVLIASVPCTNQCH